ncbi:hypothetical protein BMETH_97495710392233, partial [methanotrophic bacterial endosymbiont of Bathymodiolus sp.]
YLVSVDLFIENIGRIDIGRYIRAQVE